MAGRLSSAYTLGEKHFEAMFWSADRTSPVLLVRVLLMLLLDREFF